MKLKKIMVSLYAVVLVSCINVLNPLASEKNQGIMREMTTMELVKDMGIGINLGNTFESCGDWIAQWGDGSVESYETAWGSPVITQEMIQGYKDEGFGVLRIPVAWSNLMGEDYTISQAYLEAVREVVDWALEAKLYVILNIHYDSGWFAKFSTDKEECMYKYTRIWTQLSEAFQDYSDYLMFEALNEEGCWNDIWNRYSGDNTRKKEAYDLLNEINQRFVDIVRASGENNAKRHLLIAGYATDIDLTCDPLFKMPNDEEGRCAVSVHYYTPPAFAILEEDAEWAKMMPTWGTDEDFKQLKHYMDLMKTTYMDKGIPVIIGEYGCPKKNKEEDSIRRYLSSVCEAAYTRGMCPVLWDVTGAHYDRKTNKMIDLTLKQQLMSVVETKQQEVLGDVDGDGEVNIIDAILLKNHILQNKLLTGKALERADCTKDGEINIMDSIILKRILLGIAS